MVFVGVFWVQGPVWQVTVVQMSKWSCYVLSNASLDCMPERIHSHTDCIYLTFLQCVCFKCVLKMPV